jgi:hypothetical protein
MYGGLQTVNVWSGNVGLSLDAVGSNSSPVGFIQASIPEGSDILVAYLYSAGLPVTTSGSPQSAEDYNSAGITLSGNPIVNYSGAFGAVSERSGIGRWYSSKADVTSIVRSLATGGPDYAWAVSESSNSNTKIDGHILAVVYENPSLPEQNVILLDGGQNTGGEATVVSFASPLPVLDNDFTATMSLGISYSTGGAQSEPQYSTVTVNGDLLTTEAGGADDGILSNGGLITVGGIGDDPATGTDEIYDLLPFLSEGDETLSIFTENPSNDDNIFFMALILSAEGEVVPVEPVPEIFLAPIVAWDSVLGVEYYIEVSEELNDPNNFPFTAVPESGVVGNGERILWIDQNADAGEKFYRVVVGRLSE